jgi:hypothetical protein
VTVQQSAIGPVISNVGSAQALLQHNEGWLRFDEGVSSNIDGVEIFVTENHIVVIQWDRFTVLHINMQPKPYQYGFGNRNYHCSWSGTWMDIEGGFLNSHEMWYYNMSSAGDVMCLDKAKVPHLSWDQWSRESTYAGDLMRRGQRKYPITAETVKPTISNDPQAKQALLQQGESWLRFDEGVSTSISGVEILVTKSHIVVINGSCFTVLHANSKPFKQALGFGDRTDDRFWDNKTCFAGTWMHFDRRLGYLINSVTGELIFRPMLTN